MNRARIASISLIVIAVGAGVLMALPNPEGADDTARPAVPPTPSSDLRLVSSIPALLSALADNSVTEIVVANGTYVVPDARSSTGQVNGLWIDRRFAGRTRPVVVRAETVGGVTFSGGGAKNWLGLAFRDGVHDQTWQGFRFANAEPTQTGVIVFGQSGSVVPVAPHHITLRDITIEETITSDTPPGRSGDHGIYFSKAQTPGVHDILIDRLTVSAATSGLDSAVHFYHSAAGEPNANNVTIRHMLVTGTDQAVILWDATIHDILIEDSTITQARDTAIRYELGGTVTLRRVIATESAQHAFFSSLGPTPPGVLFDDAYLR